jgi:isocitrate/isopropylmalate dehydrogenase
VRELTGGLYFGRPQTTLEYLPRQAGRRLHGLYEKVIERILRVGFELALSPPQTDFRG